MPQAIGPNTLSEKRAKDRAIMATELKALAEGLSCTVKRRDGAMCSKPLTTCLDIAAPGGLRVTVELCGKSCQPDVHVLSWYMDLDSPNKLSPARFGGNVNPHHHHKASYVAHGYPNLVAQLTHGLRLAESGEAYQELAAA